MDVYDTIAAAATLRAAGCVAADEEAGLLADAAYGDAARFEALVARRCTGEPLAWLTGTARFCDCTVRVYPGVYVPRVQSEPLALEAAARLPARGLAVDLCTGSGAVAVVLRRRRPRARVLATDIDPRAAACAAANGVQVVVVDLAAPLPAALSGRVDVVTAVVPYVPTGELRLLARDVQAFEPRRALDGGPHGTVLLERAAAAAAALLRPGGRLLLELGAGQDALLRPALTALGFRDVQTRRDEDGDLRALVCRR
jgi:release factor glutamine methyltransferase